MPGAIEPQTLLFEDDGRFPNSRLPLLIYPGALSGDAGPEGFEALFERNGWPPQWRSTVFTYHHFHSNAHECLGVAGGEATLMFGGPKGQEVRVKAGDAVVIPAGVAHQRIVSGTGFLVVGCYPKGSPAWDLNRGNPGERTKVDENIARVPMPETDPVTGSNGGLLEAWKR